MTTERKKKPNPLLSDKQRAEWEERTAHLRPFVKELVFKPPALVQQRQERGDAL